MAEADSPSHTYDLLTPYCTRCGQHQTVIHARMAYRCEPPDNLIPISHVIVGDGVSGFGSARRV